MLLAAGGLLAVPAPMLTLTTRTNTPPSCVCKSSTRLRLDSVSEPVLVTVNVYSMSKCPKIPLVASDGVPVTAFCSSISAIEITFGSSGLLSVAAPMLSLLLGSSDKSVSIALSNTPVPVVDAWLTKVPPTKFASGASGSISITIRTVTVSPMSNKLVLEPVLSKICALAVLPSYKALISGLSPTGADTIVAGAPACGTMRTKASPYCVSKSSIKDSELRACPPVFVIARS